MGCWEIQPEAPSGMWWPCVFWGQRAVSGFPLAPLGSAPAGAHLGLKDDYAKALIQVSCGKQNLPFPSSSPLRHNIIS